MSETKEHALADRWIIMHPTEPMKLVNARWPSKESAEEYARAMIDEHGYRELYVVEIVSRVSRVLPITTQTVVAPVSPQESRTDGKVE